MTFTEIGDRVWTTERGTVNVTVIGGRRGLVVVDAPGSEAAARDLVDDVRSLASRTGQEGVAAVVNTHGHPEHTSGNGAFRTAWPGLPIHAHDEAAAGPGTSQPHPEHARPDQTFSSAQVIDLGDRALELIHPGKGHTSGDLVLRVPDADVLVVGDLVTESVPPSFGPDSWPLDWPLSLDLALGLMTPGTVVVPGHGRVVDRDHVQEQRSAIGVVAETTRDLASRGVPVTEALATADSWPWPREHLATAVERIYSQLPRSQKRLPLV